MTDTRTRPLPPKAWPAHLERRRPGRPTDVSPELVPLLRDPAQHHRLLREHLDIPERVDTRQRFGRPTVGMGASVVTCVIGWLVFTMLMFMLWG